MRAKKLKKAVSKFALKAKGPDSEKLTIDAVRIGPVTAKKLLVISSGLHGIEGFLGAAVQHALLDQLVTKKLAKGSAVLLLHALNPYGFSHLRRVNEENIDLNRNFMLKGDKYEGVHEKYRRLNGFLNPPLAPNFNELFALKAAGIVLRHGFKALKDAVVGGQYEFAKGVFFGGRGKSETYKILDRNLTKLIGKARRVYHIDFHTGLGKRGDYKLFADRDSKDLAYGELQRIFGEDKIETWSADSTSYQISGGFGMWALKKFNKIDYDVITAEFGVASPLTTIKALCYENRAHQYSDSSDEVFGQAKAKIKEAFAPEDPEWQQETIRGGLKVVEQASEALGIFNS